MAIIAASVEASGWVLRLDVSGNPGSFASYALDPGGSPRVMLASTHAGFVKSGGQAIAGSLVRALVATKPLRLPVNPASPTVAVIDESDLGGGIVRVRMALSEHVYASDTGLSLTVLAGWRTGEAAASGIAIANNSACVAPIPIMRWALLPYGVTTGSFRLAMVVASHHPVGLEPVAGIKFTVTDGSSVKTMWATALSTDNSYGDSLRCYAVTIDPATAMALTAGLLRCDAEIYPWLGSMRTTDPSGTRSMATLRSDGFSVNAASPWVIGYDPAGTRYSQQIVYVDPVNGTATAAASMVASTLAGARAVAPASRARDINTAIQAGYLTNRTLAAANGQAAQARSVDGLQIVLAAGTHATGSTSVSTGIASAEIPVRILGDPDDAAPRANCILPTSTSSIARITRLQFQQMTLEIGVNLLTVLATPLFNDVEVRGRAGFETSTTGAFTMAAAPGLWNMGLARTKWWKTASAISGGNSRAGFMRACEHSRTASWGLFVVKNRLIPGTEDMFVGTPVLTAYVGWAAATLAGQAEDIIVAWNDIRSLRGRAWAPASMTAAAAGTPNPSFRRQVFIGNVCERIGNDASPFYSFGEDASATMSYNIIEGNSFIGDRANTFYSDPLPTTIAETNSQLNQAFVNRVANNAFDWLPTKHDDFNDSQSAALRGTASGHRPQMIEAWSMLYGVGHEANVDTRRATAASPANFALEYSGPQTLTGYAASFAPQYLNDQSLVGGGAAAGGGNYRPQAGSPLNGRASRANGDVDADGAIRRVPFAAGAFQTPAIDLAPAASRLPMGSTGTFAQPFVVPLRAASAVRSADAMLAWVGALSPAGSRHAVAGSVPAVSFTAAAVLATAASRLPHRATTAGLAIDFALHPATASSGAGPTGTALVACTLAAIPVASGWSPMRASCPLLLIAGGAANATLIVGADPRTIIPDRN